MKLKQYQVDAFTSLPFTGNPAAVCPMESWPDDGLLQAIAEENNLSETAFFVPTEGGYELRWFTPASEVDLCGHATLASSHIIFDLFDHPGPIINFATRSGNLSVKRRDGLLEMNFPAATPQPHPQSEALTAGLGRQPIEVLCAFDYIAVFEDEAEVRRIDPDFTILSKLDLRGVAITSRGSDTDFVSRFFAPKLAVQEDPVTGSAHCELAPFWLERTGINPLSARQVSKRGGTLECEVVGDRVLLRGSAVTIMESVIFL